MSAFAERLARYEAGPPVRGVPAAGAGFEHRVMEAPGDLPQAPGLAPLVTQPVRRAVYLDVETTGLSTAGAALAFVVGILVRDEAAARAHLFVLWDPGAEGPMLEAVRDTLAGAMGPGAVLVTFNGRRFDVPLLAARCGRLGLAAPPWTPHLDALDHARRLLRYDLAHRNLSVLEAHLLGARRRGDVSGAEIPKIYEAFVASPCTKTRAAVERVVQHNRWDLEGLCRVAGALARIEAAPRTLGQAVGVARRLLRRDRPQAAADLLGPRVAAERDRLARCRPELAADAACTLLQALLRSGRPGDLARARALAAWAGRRLPFDDRPARLLRRVAGACL